MKFSLQLLEREIERLNGLKEINKSENAIEFFNLKIKDYKHAISILQDITKTRDD